MKMNTQTTHDPPGHTIRAQEQLWQKILDFPLDDPKALFPFSRKLARENNWDEAFTQKAIMEYRKFLLLCCISPHGASPSKVVDEVWHLHLLYTTSYWEDFCKDTIQRPLHHNPSTGGAEQREKHRSWQEDTRAEYRSFFRSEPPPDIWDDHYSPPASTTRPHRKTFRLRPFWLLLLAPLLSGCDDSNPFSPFLYLVLLFALAAGDKAIDRHKTEEYDKKKKSGDYGGSSGDSGSGCSSGGDSSCSSACGGGCGGCGGGGD